MLPSKWHIVLFALCYTITLGAQGLHFAQFPSAPLQVNPALIGEFDGDYRFNGLFRSQWNNVPVDYETFTGSVDFNLKNSCSTCSPYSFGALFTNDVSGFTRLKLTQFSIGGVIRKPLLRKHHYSFGLMLGVGQRSFDTDGLFTSVLPGNSLDPVFNENFGNMSYTFFDVAAGFNIAIMGKPMKRTRYDFGLGIYHINRPNASFVEKNSIKQSLGYNAYFIGVYELTSHWDLLYNVITQFQVGGQREVLPLFGVKHHFGNGGFWQDFAIEGMMGYRFQDAITPVFSYFVPKLAVRIHV